MSNVIAAPAQPVGLSPNQVRSEVTGHNVRYVLAVGLAGAIAALVAVGGYFGGWFYEPSLTADFQGEDFIDHTTLLIIIILILLLFGGGWYGRGRWF